MAGDPLFPQPKEAQPSVLEEFVGETGAQSYGERVVKGQHVMQAASDIYADLTERDYALLVQAERDGRIEVRRGL